MAEEFLSQFGPHGARAKMSNTIGLFLLWLSNSMQKIKKIHRAVLEIQLIKESCNLIGRPFWARFAQIWANQSFPEKSGSVTFERL